MSAIRRWCPYILVVTSVVIAILGLLFNFIIGPKVFENQVYKEIQLVEGTEAMENWLHPPIRIDMKFWFFNITNSEEFLAGAPLELEEIGPYVFEEVITKNVTRRFPNGTLEYYETTRFFFRKEDSIGDQSELITFFNAPLLGVVAQMATDPNFMPAMWLIEMLLNTDPQGVAFLTKTVEEILFQGYNITFLHLLNKALIEDMHYTPEEAAALWDKQLPPDMRDFYFAFYRMNESNPDGPYLIGTGEMDSSDFGRIHLYHYQDKLYMRPWSTDACNSINGTDGTLFPPYLDTNNLLYVFVIDLCRSMHFKFEKDVEFMDIPGKRFIIHPNSVASEVVLPENECFCVEGDCLGAGLLEVSKCLHGKPVVMSSPHFYVPEEAGDSGFNESLIHGISPSKEAHETIVDIEPITGVIIRAAKRLQANIKVRKVPDFNTFENFPSMELPVFWVEESAKLDEESGKKLYDKVLGTQKYMTIGSWVAFGLGIVLMIAGGIWAIGSRNRE